MFSSIQVLPDCLSLALSKKLNDVAGDLDHLLEVEIVDDHSVSDSRVHRGCVFKILSERYLIDLVLISLRGSKVIVGMDGLGPNGAMIYCEPQLLRV